MPAFTSIAIAGTGAIGSAIASSLLASSPEYKLTLLTRSAGSSSLDALRSHAHVTIKEVDYSSASSIAAALSGTEVLINSLGQETLGGAVFDNVVEAAIQAKLQLYVPNDWGVDYDFVKQHGGFIHPFIQNKDALRAKLRDAGLAYLNFYPGLFSSALLGVAQLDLSKRTAVIAGKGETLFNTTTEIDVGRFVALAFTKLPAAELKNRSLSVSTRQQTLNEIVTELASKHGGQPFDVKHVDTETATTQAHDLSLGVASFLTWLGLAADQGWISQPTDNEKLGFQPSISTVDAILAKMAK